MSILQTQGVPHVSLRHLKALTHVARHKNLTKAARELNRSQTTITKAIGELEQQFDTLFFDRSPAGMQPTQQGELLAQWVDLAEAEFLAAGIAYQNKKNTIKDASTLSIFSMSISYKRLASFIALYDHRDTKIAAQHLGVTRTAVSGAIRELEDLLELSLFERSPNSINCSPFCHQLAHHIKLAFAHIRHGIDDIASFDGITYGSVAVGTLPYTRTMLIPRTMNRVFDSHPQLEVLTTEGHYAQLEVALRSGKLDFIVGATRALAEKNDLVTESLFEDRLAVIVRTGHPLSSQAAVSLDDLQHFRWILPARNTPARALFERILADDHLPHPQHIIETSSLSTVRGLLLESDNVALLSEHQVYFDKLYGILSVLPITLNTTYRPIGVTMRTHTRISQASQVFLEQLRKVAREIPKL